MGGGGGEWAKALSEETADGLGGNRESDRARTSN